MPEVRFIVRWPDDSVSDCYSPSTVVKDYLQAGERYTLSDFVNRSSAALTIASERVRLKYGYACSSAADQLQRIVDTASRFDGAGQQPAEPTVLVESLHPPTL
jgi:uncharacterized repeat protein (TIGR04042 family)